MKISTSFWPHILPEMAYTFPQINGTVLVQFCSPGSKCSEEIHVHQMEESIQSVNVA